MTKRAILSAVLIGLSYATTTVGQDSPTVEDKQLSAWLTSGPASLAVASDAGKSTEVTPVSGFDYSTLPQGTADINTQVADLRAQVAQQANELTILQSRLSHTHATNDASSSRWYALYESVLVQPIQSNPTGVIIEQGTGYGHVMFPWQLEHSPRIEFGREASGRGLGWRLRYWQFRHSQSFDANAANGLIPIGNEATVGYLSEDGDITTGLAFIEEGTFRSQIRTDVLDLELQKELIDSVDLYAGMRYGKISQSYRGVTDQGIANALSEFRGVGPTAALRFTQVLPIDVLTLFGNVRGALLYGQKDYFAVDDVNNLQQNLNAIDLRDYDDGADSFAGSAEAQLGIMCQVSRCFNMRVALEAQHFMNVGGPNPTAVFTGPDSGLAGDGPLDDALSFVGVSVGGELAW